MNNDIDEYAGLPLHEIMHPVRMVHPKSVPFGPEPVRYIRRIYLPHYGWVTDITERNYNALQ